MNSLELELELELGCHFKVATRGKPFLLGKKITWSRTLNSNFGELNFFYWMTKKLGASMVLLKFLHHLLPREAEHLFVENYD